jgi:hypothetical protein
VRLTVVNTFQIKVDRPAFDRFVLSVGGLRHRLDHHDSQASFLQSWAPPSGIEAGAAATDELAKAVNEGTAALDVYRLGLGAEVDVWVSAAGKISSDASVGEDDNVARVKAAFEGT